jgi:hypothetical protein
MDTKDRYLGSQVSATTGPHPESHSALNILTPYVPKVNFSIIFTPMHSFPKYYTCYSYK